MPRYNHAYDFAFEVISEKENASDETPAMIRAGLLKRAQEIQDSELLEACECWDTYRIPEDSSNERFAP